MKRVLSVQGVAQMEAAGTRSQPGGQAARWMRALGTVHAL